MDKTTKGFVIAACSVIIATPVVWIGMQVLEQVQINAIRQAAEKKRRGVCSEGILRSPLSGRRPVSSKTNNDEGSDKASG